MEDAGLDLEGLVVASGISHYRIKSWLEARARPRADGLERIAVVLNVPVQQLVAPSGVTDHPKAASNDHFKTGQWGRVRGILTPF